MLAQILQDLYVPKELLDGLTEEQKQILFCKMREEQVRRYNEREEDFSQKNIQIKTRTKSKQVSFLLDNNGNEWCWVMGEPKPKIDEINRKNQSKNLENINPSSSTSQIDQQKQTEELPNYLNEARRLFERLVSTQENDHSPNLVDESFHREIEERAKKFEQERREVARRARDNFQRNSLQLNVCFDTDNHTSIVFQQPTNIHSQNQEQIHIELIKRNSPIGAESSPPTNEPIPLQIIEEHQRSKPLLPLTREDIRQWFCTTEIPYGTFRSPSGQIYPWFHGIISRNQTEDLLLSKPPGTYLIRINEKIYGYALSYRASDYCRHILIEVISSTISDQSIHAYRFLGGAKDEYFTQLSQLIEKYRTTPLRPNSTDVLRYPCGQTEDLQSDYSDLFTEHDKQYKSLYITPSIGASTHL